MQIQKMMADVEAKTGVRKFMQIIVVGLLVLNVVQAFTFLTMDKSTKTQLVPPEISKSFWVDGHHLAPEYLEEMGSYIVHKFASVTPSSIEGNNALILKYVHPSVHGALAVEFKTAATKLKADSISRFFFPREVRISEQSQRVALIGPVETWVGDKKVPIPEIKAYVVGFDYSNGAVTIKELHEAPEKDPFAPIN